MTLESIFNQTVYGFCFGGGMITAAVILKSLAGWSFC